MVMVLSQSRFSEHAAAVIVSIFPSTHIDTTCSKVAVIFKSILLMIQHEKASDRAKIKPYSFILLDAHAHIRTHTHTLSLTRMQAHTHTLSLSLSLSHTHTHTHTHTDAHTQRHTPSSVHIIHCNDNSKHSDGTHSHSNNNFKLIR